MIARILSIAGSDSGGGAGIQADVKTITMLGGHAMTAITAITAQNTEAVMAVRVLDPDLVLAQIDAVANDLGIDAVKIGMIGSARTARQVADRLHKLGVGGQGIPLVFDPVMIATSGAILADDETIDAFLALGEQATLVTPNLPEAAALGGAETLAGRVPALLLKGGHTTDETLVDRLFVGGGEIRSWTAPRIGTEPAHGTGCTLASAIACRLGQGAGLIRAIEDGRLFVRLGLREAPALGKGARPLGHAGVRQDVGPDLRLNQLAVGMTNYEASCAFYRALGLKQIVAAAPAYARFEAPGGITLSLSQDRAPGAALYFECACVDEAIRAAGANGLVFARPAQDRPWLWREVWIRDPAGNAICLYQAGENRRFPPWRIEG